MDLEKKSLWRRLNSFNIADIMKTEGWGDCYKLRIKNKFLPDADLIWSSNQRLLQSALSSSNFILSSLPYGQIE